MAQTLSDISETTKLDAINVLARAFVRWTPRSGRLNVHINAHPMYARSRDAVVLALNTLAQEEGYGDWEEYENADLAYRADFVPLVGLAVIKVLSRSVEDTRVKAVHALAEVFEKWIPLHEELSVELANCAPRLATIRVVHVALDALVREMDQFRDWDDYEGALFQSEPVPMLGLSAIEVLTRYPE